jgi:hypothetical protein
MISEEASRGLLIRPAQIEFSLKALGDFDLAVLLSEWSDECGP